MAGVSGSGGTPIRAAQAYPLLAFLLVGVALGTALSGMGHPCREGGVHRRELLDHRKELLEKLALHNDTVVSAVAAVADNMAVSQQLGDQKPSTVPSSCQRPVDIAFSAWVPTWAGYAQNAAAQLQPTTDVWQSPVEAVDIGVWTGQDKEDKYAWEHFFYGRLNGSYLELGGFDGKTFSNTYALHERMGWRGVLIEAENKLYEALVATRPGDIDIHAAACGTSSVVHYVPGGIGSAISGIWEFMNEDFRKKWHPNVDPSKLPAVPCLPVGGMLAKFSITHVNFFSLDVEGGELQVLQGMDLSCLTFDVITIEADGTAPAKEAAIRTLLGGAGYRYYAHELRNDWFVRSAFTPSHAPHIATPAS